MPSTSLPFDHSMTKHMGEENVKKDKMDKHNNTICIEDTLDDVMCINNDIHASDFDDLYETIDLDHDLPYIVSQQLSIPPTNEQSDLASKHGPCLKLAIVPSIVLDVYHLASFLPFLHITN